MVRGKEFHVHQAILIARSPVFEAMFTHDTKERQDCRVDIPDIPEETFQQKLRYIYGGKVESLESYTEELLIEDDKV